jgi:hypothetical protein
MARRNRRTRNNNDLTIAQAEGDVRYGPQVTQIRDLYTQAAEQRVSDINAAKQNARSARSRSRGLPARGQRDLQARRERGQDGGGGGGERLRAAQRRGRPVPGGGGARVSGRQDPDGGGPASALGRSWWTARPPRSPGRASPSTRPSRSTAPAQEARPEAAGHPGGARELHLRAPGHAGQPARRGETEGRSGQHERHDQARHRGGHQPDQGRARARPTARPGPTRAPPTARPRRTAAVAAGPARPRVSRRRCRTSFRRRSDTRRITPLTPARAPPRTSGGPTRATICCAAVPRARTLRGRRTRASPASRSSRSRSRWTWRLTSMSAARTRSGCTRSG